MSLIFEKLFLIFNHDILFILVLSLPGLLPYLTIDSSELQLTPHTYVLYCTVLYLPTYPYQIVCTASAVPSS